MNKATDQMISAGRVTVSPSEAAKDLGVSRGTIYRLIAEGHLTRAKLGRRALLKASEVLTLHERLLAAADPQTLIPAG